ncbi:MAG: hemerythrin domain-containing protein [Bacteroidales bacterium]|nr:hemerythrin domain-containing protein [Bacteroidales bacterium]
MEKKSIITEFVTCPCSSTDCSTALGLDGRDAGSSMNAEDVVDYLNRSHSGHFDGKMATLEENLNGLLAATDDIQKKIVGMFFTALRNEVAGHFEYEETVVFPYVASLLSAGEGGPREIEEGAKELIEGNHANIMEKLGDLKTIVMRHLPSSCDKKMRNKVLLNIFNLEEDLNHHIKLEDDILLPVMKNMGKDGC